MNEKTLEQLYYGKIEPVTKRVVSGSEYQMKTKMIDKAHEELLEKLNENELELLETIMDAWSDVDCLGNEEKFKEGFKLGARLIIEIFEKDEKYLESIN